MEDRRRVGIRTTGRLVRTTVCVWLMCLAPIEPSAATSTQSPEAELAVTPYKTNGIYGRGETVGWTIATTTGLPTSSRYTYVVRQNALETLASGTLDLSAGRATIEVRVDEPATIDARLTRSDAPGMRPLALGAAVAPTRLAPVVSRPADFDAFWDAKLTQLAAVPIGARLVRLEPPSPILELHEVTLASVASHAHGYLARPARPGRFPALVLFEHAGLHPLLRETALERAAEGWLAFNVSAHDAAPDAVADVPAAYESVGSTSRDTSYFLEMYLRASRAIDYIASRDDWDGRTIVVMGTSMGGQQALAAAALNRRVSMVLVNEPSGADSNGPLHGRQAGYPNWSTDNPLIMRAALYFDIVNLAPRITAPTVVAIGFVDQTAPPAGIWAAFNQIVASKEVIAMTESDHDTPEKQEAWTARSSDLLSAIRHDLPIRLRSVE